MSIESPINIHITLQHQTKRKIPQLKSLLNNLFLKFLQHHYLMPKQKVLSNCGLQVGQKQTTGWLS